MMKEFLVSTVLEVSWSPHPEVSHKAHVTKHTLTPCQNVLYYYNLTVITKLNRYWWKKKGHESNMCITENLSCGIGILWHLGKDSITLFGLGCGEPE